MVDVSTIHKHLRKEVGLFYKEGLGKLLKSQLVDYIGN